MPVFELSRPTTALLASVTNHAENHGPTDKVPAVSLGLTIQTSASVLDMLCPEARILLGVPGIESIALKTICEGWTMHIEHGIDEPIALGGCKLDKFRIEPKNDGMCELRIRVGSHDLTPLTLGMIGMKVRQEITLTVIAPKVAMQTNSDAQHKAMTKQRQAETAGQKRIDAGPAPDTPEKALARAAAKG